MNSTLTAETSRHAHPPQLERVRAATRRVTLLDRLALRLGLALIMWGRRPVRARTERYITYAELTELGKLEAARHRVRLPLGPYV